MEVSQTVTENRRIVMVGKTGVGKSSLANIIFEENVFEIDLSLNSTTKECQDRNTSVNGRMITLIDTPGFFDTERSEDERKREIVRCITQCSPGPHAFLIVLKVETFTEQEQAVINKIHEYFSEGVFKYATVLFTHGDQLTEGQTIQNFVSQNKFMKDLVKKCGGRCHVIDNKYWKDNPNDEYRSNKFQVEELLKSIDNTVTENNGCCYTNEIREQAKVTVSTKIWIRLAGTTTGALLGALFGVVAVEAVCVTVGSKFKDLVGLPKTVAGGAAEGEIAAVVVVGTAAAVGGVLGGMRGFEAAEGADTALEATKRAAVAVKDEAISVYNAAYDVLNKMFTSK